MVRAQHRVRAMNGRDRREDVARITFTGVIVEQAAGARVEFGGKGLDLIAQEIEMGVVVQKICARGQRRDDEHPVENIFTVQIVLAPMLLHPRRVLRINDKFGGRDNGITGKNLRFAAARVIAGIPSCLQILQAP